MKRREFITLLSGAAACPLAARSQEANRVRRIGVLLAGDENDPERKTMVSAFTQALAALGWTDGRNVRMDLRWFDACLSGSLPLMMPGGSNHRCRDFYTWELRRGQPIQERS